MRQSCFVPFPLPESLEDYVCNFKKKRYEDYKEGYIKAREKDLQKLQEDVAKFSKEKEFFSKASHKDKAKRVYDKYKRQQLLLRMFGRKDLPKLKFTDILNFTDEELEKEFFFHPVDQSREVDQSSEEKRINDFYEQQMKEIEANKNCVDVVLTTEGRMFTTEEVDEIVKQLQSLKNKNYQIKLIVKTERTDATLQNGVPYYYTPEETKILLKLNNAARPYIQDGILYFHEGCSNDAMSFSKVVQGNKLIHEVAQEVKRLKLTPFEAVVYIHNICTQLRYIDNNEISDSSNIIEAFTSTLKYMVGSTVSRTLPDMVEKGYIVCVGYASLFKAICDELQMPGLKASLNACTIEEGLIFKQVEGHANNIVEITDPKYGIKGTYMEDTCWDSEKPSKYKNKTMAFCLYPVEDMQNLKQMRIVFEGDAMSQQEYTSVAVTEGNEKEEKKKFALLTKNFIKENGIYEPISIQKYYTALLNIQQKMGVPQAEAEETAQTIIENSQQFATELFKKRAKNNFVNPKLKKQSVKKKPMQMLEEEIEQELAHNKEVFNAETLGISK